MTRIDASQTPAVGDALILAKFVETLLTNTRKMKQTAKEILSTAVEKKIALEAAVRQKKLLMMIMALRASIVMKMGLHLELIIWIIVLMTEHYTDHTLILLIFAPAM